MIPGVAWNWQVGATYVVCDMRSTYKKLTTLDFDSIPKLQLYLPKCTLKKIKSLILLKLIFAFTFKTKNIYNMSLFKDQLFLSLYTSYRSQSNLFLES